MSGLGRREPATPWSSAHRVAAGAVVFLALGLASCVVPDPPPPTSTTTSTSLPHPTLDGVRLYGPSYLPGCAPNAVDPPTWQFFLWNQSGVTIHVVSASAPSLAAPLDIQPADIPDSTQGVATINTPPSSASLPVATATITAGGQTYSVPQSGTIGCPVLP